jgi:uncharacterized metal-binding protein
MADGKTHDRIGLALTPTAVLGAIAVAQRLHNPRLAWVGAIAYVIGITHLSPDIDLKSNPWRRWGILRWIWWGYQQMGHHRGFSHDIIVGTLSRVIYLGLPLLVGLWLSGRQAVIVEILRYRQEMVMALVALEISAWVHLMLDGIFLERIGRIFRVGG